MLFYNSLYLLLYFFFTANSDCGLKKQGVALPAANTHLNNFWNARLDIVMYPQTDDW